MKIEGHKILFKAIVGSQSYGTNIEGSDIDYKGVFLQDPQDLYLNGYKDELRLNKDEVYVELDKFLSLCSTGNPTYLELLYSPENCIVHNTEDFKKISKIRHLFLTKNLRHSFGNYAAEQIRKAGGLKKKMNWEKEKTVRKTVEDMCSVYSFDMKVEQPKINRRDFIKEFLGIYPYASSAIKLNKWLEINGFRNQDCGLVKIEHFRDCYILFHSKDNKYKGISSGEYANEVSLSEIPKYEKPLAILFFHRDAYSTHCKEYREYEKWLEDRNTLRYVDVEGHGQKIDGKNILHCTRILETALEIPTQKTINVYRENREFLIGIRRGQFDLQTLISKAESNLATLNELFLSSDLPEKFEHHDLINSISKEIKMNYYMLQK